MRITTLARAGVAATMLLVAGCSLAVEHGLDERSANEVVSTLERAGVGARKREDDGSNPATFSINVAQADAMRALEALRAAGLPRENRAGLGEVFAKPSLLPTPSEDRARLMTALGNDLARTLETIDGVVDARVHVVLDDRDPSEPAARDDKPAAHASVLLKVRPEARAVSITDVQRLVAGAVPGVVPDNVVVVTTPAAATATEPAWSALGPLRVSPGSRALLLGGWGLLLGVIALLAGLLYVTARRLANLERKSDHETPGAPEA